MELLIEFILELVLEGSIELLPNKKVPKWIRFLLAAIMVLAFGFVIILLIVVGILEIKKSLGISIFFIGMGLYFFIGSIIKIKKIIKQIKN